MAKKMSKLDAAIEKEFYKQAFGVQIPISQITKFLDEVRMAVISADDVSNQAISAAVAKALQPYR
jgi:hypothetical protein